MDWNSTYLLYSRHRVNTITVSDFNTDQMSSCYFCACLRFGTVIVCIWWNQFSDGGHNLTSWNVESIIFVLQRVRLHFLRFDLNSWPGCNDSLDIYDGSDSTALLVYSSCGGSNPGDVVSSGSTIFISFSATKYSDFRIVYQAVVPVPGKAPYCVTHSGKRTILLSYTTQDYRKSIVTMCS